MKTGALGSCQRAVARSRGLAWTSVGVALAALTLAGCQSGGEMFQAKFARSQELTPRLTDIAGLDVGTNVGALRLEAGDVPEIRIAAEIKVKARTEEQAEQWAEQVGIVAEPRGRTLVIKAEKPAGLRDNQLSVDFAIIAPGRLALDCTTNVGDIRTTGFTGRVQARTNVGTVTCLDLRDEVELHTNVGDIRAEYAADAPAALHAGVSTDVGSIVFQGPAQISAQLTDTANVGAIDTERPLTVVGSVGHSVNTSLGNGDGRVSLTTNVGSIRIR